MFLSVFCRVTASQILFLLQPYENKGGQSERWVSIVNKKMSESEDFFDDDFDEDDFEEDDFDEFSSALDSHDESTPLKSKNQEEDAADALRKAEAIAREIAGTPSP